MKRTAWWVGLGIVVMWSCLSAGTVWAEPPREARIKAVLILRLLKFVDWPTDSAARVAESLQICTWGDSPTEAALHHLQGQKIREREIRIRKLGTPLDTRSCHVLFVSEGVRDVTPAQLYNSGSAALLTISDMPDFNKRGGIGRNLTIELLEFLDGIGATQRNGLVRHAASMPITCLHVQRMKR